MLVKGITDVIANKAETPVKFQSDWANLTQLPYLSLLEFIRSDVLYDTEKVPYFHFHCITN